MAIIKELFAQFLNSIFIVISLIIVLSLEIDFISLLGYYDHILPTFINDGDIKLDHMSVLFYSGILIISLIEIVKHKLELY